MDYTSLSRKLGRDLRQIRRQREMKQADLALITCVSDATICNFERGNHSILVDTLQAILEPLGLTLAIVPADSNPGALAAHIEACETCKKWDKGMREQ